MNLAFNTWRKTSFSQGTSNCIEAGIWKKSLLSQGTSNCVEATVEESFVLVRDTKISRCIGDDAPVQSYSLAAWQKLIDAFKSGTFDDYTGSVKFGRNQILELRKTTQGMIKWRVSGQTTVHEFTADEMHAFVVGAKADEFDLTPAMAELVASYA